MPSKVSFQPKLFYDSVMKDTFFSRLHDLFLGCSIEKQGRPKQNKLAKKTPQVNSTLLLVYFIFQEAQKKMRDKPLLNLWKSTFCLQKLNQTLLLPHSGFAGKCAFKRLWHQASTTTAPLHRADVGAPWCQSVPA